jgi:hypothetical protein
MSAITGIDIKGKHVVLRPEALAPEFRTAEFQVVLAVDGFGTNPTASGQAVFVRFSDGDEARFERYHVERLATPDEIAAFEQRLANA